MGSGGGGAPQVQKQEVTTTNLPAYLQPYVTDIAQRAQAESNREYTPYGAQRIAGFTDAQTNAQNMATGMQRPGQYGAASNMATQAGLGALNAGQNFQQGQFSSNQVQGPRLQNYQMQGPQNVAAQQYNAPQMRTAQTGYNPQLQDYQMRGPQDVTAQQYNAPQMQSAQTDYNPQLQDYQMQGPANVSASQLQDYQMQGPDRFDSAQAQQYMSPYMQNVVDVQKQQAVRDAKIGQLSGNLAAARQGTYGGARQLLAGTERERNLGQQLGQIQATGSQNAFQNAQQQFNTQQQAQQGANQQNLAARLGIQQLGSGQNMQAGLANQQMGYNVGNQNLQANLGVQQLGSGQNMQAQLANQQYDMDAQRQAEQSKQFGANLGLQGAQAANQAAQNLGNLGTAQQTSDMQRMQAMSAAGREQQGLQQQGMDQRYADFLRQLNFPQEQLSYYSNLVRGLPQTMGSTQTTYAPAPSLASQIGGAGLAAASAYQLGR